MDTMDTSIFQAISVLQRRTPGLYFGTALFGPELILHPLEERLCSRQSAAYAPNFISGRAAARRALLQMGIAQAVSADEDGVPIFPQGVVGSIAHKHQRGVAVVASERIFHSIGVDLEWDTREADEDSLMTRVCSPGEERIEETLRNSGVLSPATLILSAKEAVYKASFPVSRENFDFNDFALEVDVGDRAFCASDIPGGGHVTVNYEVFQRWVVTVALWGPGKCV